MQKYLRRHPEWWLYLIAGVGLVGSIPSMLVQMERASALKQEVQSRNADVQRLQALREDAANRDQIARDRFNSCLFVRTETSQTVVGISPGQRIVDNVTRRPLAPGTIVCSIDGNTGIVGANGVVGDVAFTGDRSSVQTALQRSGIQIAPSSSQFGSSNRTYQED